MFKRVAILTLITFTVLLTYQVVFARVQTCYVCVEIEILCGGDCDVYGCHDSPACPGPYPLLCYFWGEVPQGAEWPCPYQPGIYFGQCCENYL
jgi:hypothetical protein